MVEVLDVMEAKGEEAGQAAEQLERLLFILHTVVSYRDGAKITKPEDVCQVRGEDKFKYTKISFRPKVKMLDRIACAFQLYVFNILFPHVYRRCLG